MFGLALCEAGDGERVALETNGGIRAVDTQEAIAKDLDAVGNKSHASDRRL